MTSCLRLQRAFDLFDLRESARRLNVFLLGSLGFEVDIGPGRCFDLVRIRTLNTGCDMGATILYKGYLFAWDLGDLLQVFVQFALLLSWPKCLWRVRVGVALLDIDIVGFAEEGVQRDRSRVSMVSMKLGTFSVSCGICIHRAQSVYPRQCLTTGM